MITYSVEEHPDAIIVRGTVPMADWIALAERAQPLGLKQMDVGLCQALGAVMVAVNDAGAARLRSEHEARIADLDPLERWRCGVDTGTSSLTMAHAIFGLPFPDGRGPDLPHDPGDFGRCLRFLEAVPGAREGLAAVCERYPEWGPLVREWDSLEALYREEEPSGHAPRLYARLQELRGEGDDLTRSSP